MNRLSMFTITSLQNRCRAHEEDSVDTITDVRIKL